ncbi:hypothetical protein SUGI_0543140 [Cryptomeria japonica]|nr:hypothetical protein SUGI_0543140 [Cryptomeria japonica]
MSGMEPVGWEDEESEERNSGGRDPLQHFQSLQSSMMSVFDEYCKHMEAKLIRAKKDNKELAKTNKKLKEELNRAKEVEESCKQNLEQTRNKVRKLCTTIVAVKEECDEVCNQGGVLDQQLSKRRKHVCPICLEPWSESGEHNVWYVENANGFQIIITSISFSYY